MSSAVLYEGVVEHIRGAPFERRFRYRIALACLDLDRLDEAFDGHWLASHRRPAPLRWRRRDHFGDPDRPLVDCVRERVAEETGRPSSGPVRLLTQLRHLGYGFNPASFFYCYEEDGRSLAGVLVEVTNTPWRERHLYWVGRTAHDPGAGVVGGCDKSFHVSPFMGMDTRYDFRVAAPGPRLRLAIICRREGSPFFAARLDCEARPWSSRALARHALVHAARPLRLHAAIYAQALRLALARVPFHPHPVGRRADRSSEVPLS